MSEATAFEQDIFSECASTLSWPSVRAEKGSAWHGHVAFAHWLVCAAKPSVIVELGSHNGVSYAAFCNAVANLHLATQCHAIDTWQGDEHAGMYGEDVYRDISAFNRANYAAFSTLHRCTFDDALPSFPDGSVDVLHIDGLHSYEAVKHDYDTWLPKLSSRGIVLFHDTEAHNPGFGVWRLWAELSASRPSFNFLHSAGLGVLAAGPSLPSLVAELCRRQGSAAGTVRQRFEDASRAAYQSGLQPAPQPDVPARPSSQNVALGKSAMQSSSFQGSDPRGAVNGHKTGAYGFHTELERNPWWMLDLGALHPVHQIVVYNRLDGICKIRSRNLVILVSDDGERWTTIYTHDGRPFGGADGSPLHVPYAGPAFRFVRIRLNDYQFFHLDEVEVFV